MQRERPRKPLAEVIIQCAPLRATSSEPGRLHHLGLCVNGPSVTVTHPRLRFANLFAKDCGEETVAWMQEIFSQFRQAGTPNSAEAS